MSARGSSKRGGLEASRGVCAAAARRPSATGQGPGALPTEQWETGRGGASDTCPQRRTAPGSPLIPSGPFVTAFSPESLRPLCARPL